MKPPPTRAVDRLQSDRIRLHQLHQALQSAMVEASEIWDAAEEAGEDSDPEALALLADILPPLRALLADLQSIEATINSMGRRLR